MTNKIKGSNNNGPVLVCGAASVSFSHENGAPTSYDRFFAAVKNLFSGERRRTEAANDAVAGPAERSAAASYSVAS